MKKILPKLGILLLVLVMLAPIAVDMIESTPLRNIKYSRLEKVISQTSNFKFAMVYVAPKSEESLKDDTAKMKVAIDEIEEEDEAMVTLSGSNGYVNEPTGTYYIDYDKLADDEKEFIFGSEDSDHAYLFIANGEVLKTITKKLSVDELKENYKLYSCHGIDEEHTNYKVAKDAKEYSKAVKQKDVVTMAVFGRDTCYYCNQFKVVYNTVMEEKGLENIYYFDSDSYDEKEYDKVMDSGLKIPAACNNKGEEVDLQEGFSTPLTLFTKNGKVIDCISGYVTKESLITKLQTVGMLKQ